MPSKKVVFAAAAAIFGIIVFATLSPMAWRPVLISHAESEHVAIVERLLAYGVMGFLVAILLPGRMWLSCILVVLFACSLELLQEFRPDRHALLRDGFEKAVGGVIGVWLASLINGNAFRLGRHPRSDLS